jgi:hypothetical protein
MNRLHKTFFVSKADREIAQWITATKKILPNVDDTHYAVGVIAISFGLPNLFVDHLYQSKDKTKLLSQLRNYPKPEQSVFLSCLAAKASSEEEKHWF